MTIHMQTLYCEPFLGDIPLLSFRWINDAESEPEIRYCSIPVVSGIPHWHFAPRWDMWPFWSNLLDDPEVIVQTLKSLWERYLLAKEGGE